MIIRHIPMRSIRKSSFKELLRYLTDPQNIKERVGEISISNCHSMDVDWALKEIEATHAQNQRARGDKTYHLLISFPEGEIPSSTILKDIEDRVCASVGYAKHQRISVIHSDTDNLHIHIAINKIHPVSYTMKEPYRAYRVFGEIATKLEIEHGLQQTNHTPKKTLSENLADDMEHHSGVESLLNWIKRECLTEMRAAKSWAKLHQIMEEKGLEISERGNGLIIKNNNGFAVKASSVSRELSKSQLEKRLGFFEKTTRKIFGHKPTLLKKQGVKKFGDKPPIFRQKKLINIAQLERLVLDNGSYYKLRPVTNKINTDVLFTRYQTEQNNKSDSLSLEIKALRRRKERLINDAKGLGRLKRAAIKLIRDKGINKKVLYQFSSKSLLNQLGQIRKQNLKEREVIYKKYQRVTWADWLRLQALGGHHEALTVLRSTHPRKPLKSDSLTGKKKEIKSSINKESIDTITKKGTIIYREDETAIRDDGEVLKITKSFSEASLKMALRFAIQRYGSCLSVKGSQEFKEEIVKISASLRLPITFDDALLQKRHQDLLNTINKEEKAHDSRRPTERRGPNRSSAKNARAVKRDDILPGNERVRNPNNGKINKPHLGSIGSKPPPSGQNRLRNLSELGLVQFTNRSSMLLQSDVPGHLEHQKSQSTNGMRRDVFRPGIAKNKGEMAADKYIAERESKRQRLTDIPLHRRSHSGEQGSVQFAGLREVDGEKLALLKREGEIIVLPIGTSLALRMKQLFIGAPVMLSVRGIVLEKGRKR